MPRIVPVAAAVALLALAVPQAGSDGRVVRIRDGLVGFEIPRDWREIDPTHLAELTLWTADATAGRVASAFQHGYRPILPPDHPGLPQIMVQIREDGRLRYGDFLDLPAAGEPIEGPLDRFADGVPPLVVGVSVENVSFDRSDFTLRLEHALDLRIRGRARVLTGAVLTERGFVAFHYVDRERRIEQGRAVFEELLDSVVIDPEIAYRPRWTDRWPGLPFFAAAAVVAALLGVFLAVRGRRGS